MINKNNLEQIKALADKIEYTVTNVKKELRVSPSSHYDTAWDVYTDDIRGKYDEVKNDIIAIINRSRDYSNIFLKRGSKQTINNYIDLSRIPTLTKKQRDLIQYAQINDDAEIEVEYEEEINEKSKQHTLEKLNKHVTIATVSSQGYSQGDYEEYIVAYYDDIKDENLVTLKYLLNDLKYIFTVSEFYINVVDIETRLYTSGIEEIEEVEVESYGTVEYSGSYNEKELQAQYPDYEIIYNN